MAPQKPTPQWTQTHPFLLSVEDVAMKLETDLDRGLTAMQVQSLIKEYGLNELEDGGGVNWYKILFKQLCNAMILVNFSDSLY